MTADARHRAGAGPMTSTGTRVRIAERLDRAASWLRPGRITGDAFAVYEAIGFPKNRWGGIERELRKLQATGGLVDDRSDWFLDVMDAECETILDTFPITRAAFERLRASWKFRRDRSSEEAYAAWAASEERADAPR